MTSLDEALSTTLCQDLKWSPGGSLSPVPALVS